MGNGGSKDHVADCLRQEQAKAARLEALLKEARSERTAAESSQRSMQVGLAALSAALLLAGGGAWTLRRQVHNARLAAQRLSARHEAELGDMRRRAAQDVQKAEKFAISNFAKDLLVIGDNLEYAQQHSRMQQAEQQVQQEALAEGVDLTMQSLLATLERHGVSKQEALGEQFDPNQHEAVRQVPSTAAPGSIVEVFRSGYLLHERVLRAAQVVVAAAPPSAEEKAEDVTSEVASESGSRSA
eukprot:TRINITY_DN49398_c0_g1_i1.p1 TRINITY_DN49398_c0_g1~~TRINITY_DN49398_c0_g1_i1.p1  ORF type:complete len:250 (-),score=73.96 TRINITY_DN49398_c0_g1_i1:18-743(-)